MLLCPKRVPDAAHLHVLTPIKGRVRQQPGRKVKAGVEMIYSAVLVMEREPSLPPVESFLVFFFFFCDPRTTSPR